MRSHAQRALMVLPALLVMLMTAGAVTAYAAGGRCATLPRSVPRVLQAQRAHGVPAPVHRRHVQRRPPGRAHRCSRHVDSLRAPRALAAGTMITAGSAPAPVQPPASRRDASVRAGTTLSTPRAAPRGPAARLLAVHLPRPSRLRHSPGVASLLLPPPPPMIASSQPGHAPEPASFATLLAVACAGLIGLLVLMVARRPL